MHRICIGILARNEAAHIGHLIEDLGHQTLLCNDDIALELHVVANACTDNTVAVAHEALKNGSFKRGHFKAHVHHLSRGGKSNAWNEFVHRLVPAGTDYVFLLDGDIRIPEKESLQTVLNALIATPHAVVAVDKSVKDLSLQKPKTPIEWLIKAGTGTADDTRTAIAGALYCARYKELTNIWMPIGLPGEDGFLRAMLLTSGFSERENLGRHVYVDGARHIFEAVRDLRGVFRHNVRLAIGSGINFLLFAHIRNLTAAGVDVANYIKERNDSDPNWINSLVHDKVTNGSYFPIGRSFLTRRLWRFKRLTLWNQVKGTPVLLIGLTFDLLVYLRANTLMRRGAGAGFW